MLNPEQSTTLERKIERFAHILAQKPGDGLTVLALAEASFRRGLKLEALTNYQVVTSEQAVPEAHLAVAEIYSQQNMTTEAYGELRQLFRIDPENVEARLLAHTLRERTGAPEDIMQILNEPTSDEAFSEAKLRLQIQRAIHNRELQERTRNGTLEPGVVIHEYYIEEAKKKLIEVQDCLRKLEELKEHNAQLREMPRAEPVSAQPEPVSESDQEQSPAQELETTSPVEPVEPVEESEEALQETAAGVEELPSPLPADAEDEIPLAEVHQDPSAQMEMTPEGVVEESSEAEVSKEPEQMSDAEEQLHRPTFLESPEDSDTELSLVSAQAQAPEEVPQTAADHLPEAASDFPQPLHEEIHQVQLEESPDPYSAEPSLEMETALELQPMEMEQAAVDENPEPVTDISGEAPIDPEDTLSLSTGLLPVSSPALEETQAHHFEPPSLEDIPNQILEEASLEPEPPSVYEETRAIEIEDLGITSEPSPAIQDEIDFTAVPPPEPVPVSTSDSFDLNFEIGVESLVSPDLPEESYTPPPTIEMSPIQEDSSEMTAAPGPPAVEFVDEEGGGLSLLPTESDLQDSEPVEAAVERDASPQGRAAERQAFYESKAEELGKLTGTLARTRGVTSIFLVARDGSTIDSVVKDDITEERVGELVKESFEFLLAYAKSPAYWVLECSGGIFVMQTLDDYHVLIAIGQAGANFGALRYTMDKTKTKFGEILNDVPR